MILGEMEFTLRGIEEVAIEEVKEDEVEKMARFV